MSSDGRGWGRRHWLPFLYRKTVRLRTTGPIVTFTFDDFPRSAYLYGGRILRDFNARGTFYASYGLVNSTNSSGDFAHVEDLYSLIAEGHELASHTLHHSSSYAMGLSAYVQEVRDGKAALQDIPGLTVSNNFAYPFGAVTARAKKKVGAEMLSCRSIYRGLNGSTFDASLLRANPLYGDIEMLHSVRRLIRENEESHGWLIFYTHDVQASPSPHGCTPALLEAAIRMAVDSSMKVLTVDEVMSQSCQ